MYDKYLIGHESLEEVEPKNTRFHRNTPCIDDICECIERTLQRDSKYSIRRDLGIGITTQTKIIEALRRGGAIDDTQL